jgi:ubiquinone/menaquinone biosynthesis C-methylase UbiE
VSNNSTTRFSDKVDNYIKYRPHYPKEVIDYLKSQNILSDGSVIADIGSGTGISTEMFLKNGNKVYAVEPNKEMREAAERLLKGYKNFLSVNGTAEDTTLSDSSIDLITAGQAFHWFDIPKAKAEFKRILKNNGYVVLMWNERKLDTTPFLRAYEELLLKYGTDYEKVRHENINTEVLNGFFTHGYSAKSFSNGQVFDFEGIKGRLLSSSYVPGEGDKNYAPMIAGLEDIFSRYNESGKVNFEYDTNIYFGGI